MRNKRYPGTLFKQVNKLFKGGGGGVGEGSYTSKHWQLADPKYKQRSASVINCAHSA